jgi:hypothetical protein
MNDTQTKGFEMTTLDSSLPYCGMGNIENLNAFMQRLFADCIEVPNSWLPTEFHDNVRGGRTLERLEELCAERDREFTQHQLDKQAKARNIERLAAQVEAKSRYAAHGDFIDLDSELDYNDNETDEIKLHRNMMALVGGMVNGGLVDADDLLED